MHEHNLRQCGLIGQHPPVEATHPGQRQLRDTTVDQVFVLNPRGAVRRGAYQGGRVRYHPKPRPAVGHRLLSGLSEGGDLTLRVDRFIDASAKLSRKEADHVY